MIEHFDQTDASLARLRGPIGIYIGSKTPPEIAVSVMAEILAVKNAVTLPREAAVAVAKARRGLNPFSPFAGPAVPARKVVLRPIARCISARFARFGAGHREGEEAGHEHEAEAGGDQDAGQRCHPPGGHEHGDVEDQDEGAHGDQATRDESGGGVK